MTDRLPNSLHKISELSGQALENPDPMELLKTMREIWKLSTSSLILDLLHSPNNNEEETCKQKTQKAHR